MNTIYATIFKHISTLDRCECFEKQKTILRSYISRLANNEENSSVVLIGQTCSARKVLRDTIQSVVITNDTEIKRVTLHGSLHSDPKDLKTELQQQLSDISSLDIENSISTDMIEQCLLSIANHDARNCVLIVLYEFELFATGLFQNFLYNILNKVHNIDSKYPPLMVVCTSSKLDATDHLEKRVRSRLCQRQLYLTADWSFELYLDLAKQCLIIGREDMKKLHATSGRQWDANVEKILRGEAVAHALRAIFYQDKSLEYMKQFLIRVLNNAARENMILKAEHFSEALKSFNTDSISCTLSSLNSLELGLVIACMQYQKKFVDDEVINFEKIFSEFRESLKSNRSGPNKTLARKAMQKLETSGVFVSKTESSAADDLPALALYDFKVFRLQLDGNDVVNFIKKSDCSHELKAWIKNGIF